MDGVIIDSEKHWKKAELSFFGELLPSWTKEDQQKIIGINVNDTYRILANEYGLEMTHQEFLRRVNGIALEVYRSKCNLIDGFIELITELKKTSIEQDVKIWKRIASDLERPTKQRRAVNLSRIDRYSKSNLVLVQTPQCNHCTRPTTHAHSWPVSTT